VIELAVLPAEFETNSVPVEFNATPVGHRYRWVVTGETPPADEHPVSTAAIVRTETRRLHGMHPGLLRRDASPWRNLLC
jgi:hypothetical protein